MLKTTSTSTWENENARWKAHFTNTLTRQVKRLNSLVLEKKQTPDALRKHFDSILQIFREASKDPNPDTHRALLRLVHDLHPLPIWWGKWNTWIHVIETAAQIAHETKNVNEESWLELTQAEMQLSAGNAEKALFFAKKAHRLAQKHNPELVFRAELTIFESQKHLGLNGTRLHNAIIALEKSLDDKKALIPPKVAQELEIELILQKIEVARKQTNIQKTSKLARQAQQLAEEIFTENDLFMAKIFAMRSSIYWANQEPELAISSSQKTIQLYKYWGDRTEQLETSGRLGLYYWSAEQHRNAEQALQASIEMAESLKLFSPQAVHSATLGLVHFSCGRLEQALALTQQHHILSKLTNNLAETRRAHGNMGAIQTHLGDFKNALQNLRADHEHAKQAQLPQPKVRLYAKIAWALDGLGIYDEAMEHAETALFLAEKLDEPLVRLMALRSLSETTNELNDKIRYAEEARMLAVKYSRRLNEAATLLTLAGCRQDDSLHADAVRILEEIGATAWLDAPKVFKSLRLALLL